MVSPVKLADGSVEDTTVHDKEDGGNISPQGVSATALCAAQDSDNSTESKPSTASKDLGEPDVVANAVRAAEEDRSATETKETKRESLVREAREVVRLLLEAVDKDPNPSKEPGLAFSRNPLKAFSSSTHVTVEKFSGSGGLRSLVIILRKHSGSSDAVDCACKALGAFVLCESSAINEVVKAGGIDAVIEAVSIQTTSKHETACVSALKMLRNLTQNAPDRITIFKNGGMEAVINAMKTNPDDARLNSHAALVLSNLAFGNPEIKTAVGVIGGLTAISDAMKRHGDYQQMQARGSLAMRNLCYQSEDNQHSAGDNGAIEALLKAIDAYTDDREIAHQSCVALANLSNLNEENRAKIVLADGSIIVTKLMKKYTQSATVNDDSISILRNLAVGHESAQVEIGRNGGIELIIAAMKHFQNDSKMVEKGTAALRYLCFTAENRERVAKCGGIEAIVGALISNKKTASAVENSMLAIGNATFEAPESKAVVGRCGGIQAIIAGIEEHRLSEVIQEHGCRVLRNLADGFEFNRRLEVECGAINTAIFAMMGYPDNAAVQEQGLAMLLNIARGEATVEKLLAADVERLAEKAINRHGKNRGVCLQGGQLLDKLHGYDDSGASPRSQQSNGENGNGRFGLRGLLKRK